MIHLVRHARAGSRTDWLGPDHERPLSGRGQLQATRLADRLADAGATLVYSSPYARCIQTVAPLASLLGVDIEVSSELAEGAGAEGAARLIGSAPGGAVLCSHGDVLLDVIGHLAAHGAPLVMGMPFEKGAILTLRRDGGRIVHASYDPPDRWPMTRHGSPGE